MRLLCCCLALTALASLGGAEEPKVEWHKYAPKGARAEVQFPGKAVEKNTKYGSNLVLTAPGDRSAYLLSYKDFTNELDLADKALVKKVLDNSREGSSRKLRGKLLREKDVALGKAIGREFDLAAPGLGIYRSRVYLTPKRVVQVTVVGPKELVESETATKFLGSLKLLD